MAVSFENSYVILSQERAEHINERHVDLDKEHRASKFLPFFNLTSTLALLARKTFPGQSRLQDHRARIQAGPWVLLYLHLQDEKSNWSLSVALSHGRDLHLLFLEGGLRGQIQDHISISIFPRILLIPEGQKKWNDVLLVRALLGAFQ